MPNLLAHFGVQLLPARALTGITDIRWLGLACLIPDVPWILQRTLWTVVPGIDPLRLRLYCIILASLFFSLVLSLCIALLTSQPRRIFLLLGGGSLAHLLLDAMQTKWANGVHLLAPFDWRLAQIGLFWPESAVTVFLSAAGLFVFLAFGRRNRYPAATPPPGRRVAAASILLLLYGTAPLLLMTGPLQADNHFVRTLQDRSARTGKPIAFDRGSYTRETGMLTIFSKERLKVTGRLPRKDGSVSVSGYFLDNRTVFVEALHEHWSFRDTLSLVGLALLAVVWLLPAGPRRQGGTSTASLCPDTDPPQPTADDQ